MPQHFDDAVVGAGILGLAHAYHLAKRGHRVVVFERHLRAMGASVRNFGTLSVLGLALGSMYRMALCSRDIWLEVLQASGLWYDTTGSMCVAYHQDEACLLSEFFQDALENRVEVSFLTPSQILERTPAVNSDGLIAGLWSGTEMCVDPRQVVAALPVWLHEAYGVEFVFDCAVTAYDHPCIVVDGREWHADHLFVCSGDDLQTLYPDTLKNSGLVRCKLQMMLSQPFDWRLGPMLISGLSLCVYKAFRRCPSFPALKQRIATEMPEYDRYGIHVVVSQIENGQLVIGNSHEYDDDIAPFDKEEVNELILQYMHRHLNVPDLHIVSRWHGIYTEHPEKPYVVEHPAPGATIITGPGGYGMTLSFGLAEQVVNETLG